MLIFSLSLFSSARLSKNASPFAVLLRFLDDLLRLDGVKVVVEGRFFLDLFFGGDIFYCL